MNYNNKCQSHPKQNHRGRCMALQPQIKEGCTKRSIKEIIQFKGRQLKFASLHALGFVVRVVGKRKRKMVVIIGNRDIPRVPHIVADAHTRIMHPPTIEITQIRTPRRGAVHMVCQRRRNEQGQHQ